MFSLGSTIREINNDRHRKYPPSRKPTTNKKLLTKDVGRSSADICIKICIL